MNAKHRAEWASVASVLWLLAATAFAEEPHRFPQGRNAGNGPQRMMPAEQRPEQSSPRDADALAPGAGNRLSPEERRQLRRDVHEAGRELYSDRMGPGRRERRRQ